MTDIEINKALALAIGWKRVMLDTRSVFVFVQTLENGSGFWRKFDYTAFEVIWPIAERYNAFPRRMYSTWCALHRKLSPGVSCPYYADTAAKAVALAVIGAAS